MSCHSAEVLARLQVRQAGSMVTALNAFAMHLWFDALQRMLHVLQLLSRSKRLHAESELCLKQTGSFTCVQEAQFLVCWCSLLSSLCLSIPAKRSAGVSAAAPAYCGPPPPCLFSHFLSADTPLQHRGMSAGDICCSLSGMRADVTGCCTAVHGLHECALQALVKVCCSCVTSACSAEPANTVHWQDTEGKHELPSAVPARFGEDPTEHVPNISRSKRTYQTRQAGSSAPQDAGPALSGAATVTAGA